MVLKILCVIERTCGHF